MLDTTKKSKATMFAIAAMAVIGVCLVGYAKMRPAPAPAKPPIVKLIPLPPAPPGAAPVPLPKPAPKASVRVAAKAKAKPVKAKHEALPKADKEPVREAVIADCKQDFFHFCRDTLTEGKASIIECMVAHKSELSPKCKGRLR